MDDKAISCLILFATNYHFFFLFFYHDSFLNYQGEDVVPTPNRKLSLNLWEIPAHRGMKFDPKGQILLECSFKNSLIRERAVCLSQIKV